jgi:anti-sigma regulatory factor (Ser/Thr protein kinase)
MKVSVVVRGEYSLEHFPTPFQPVANYCSKHRSASDSKCMRHYTQLFKGELPQGVVEGILTPCPYGLVTTLPIRIGEEDVIFYGFAIPQIQVPQGDIPNQAFTTIDEARHFLDMLEVFGSSIKKEELWHFEAALHDVRHLNHAIGLNAEQLLTQYGFPPKDDWNMDDLRKNEVARRALSVFAASRDLSSAVSLHEISRDPSQAGGAKSPLHIHRAFYRQARISEERLLKSKLKLSMGKTEKTLNLSESFKLIPKILIDNAIKYAEFGSEIRVEFSERPQSFEISVKNSGAILRPDELDQIFRRGVRGSNKEKIAGHGLGLWLAKLIVEANSGVIKMETQQTAVDFRGRKMGTTSVVVRLI